MESMYLKYFINESHSPFFTNICTHSTDFQIHTHVDFNELVIILNGSATHIVDGQQYFIKKGDVFVINDKTSHGYVNTNDLKICNIMYRPENFLTNLNEIRKLPGFHALFVIEPYLTHAKEFTSRLSLSPSEYLTIKNFIDLLIDEFNNHLDGRYDMIQSLFTMIAVFLSRHYNVHSNTSDLMLLNIAASVSYMESNFTSSIKMSDLADISNLSTRHFNRLFKETYGTTPSSYLTNLRLDMASHLLVSTNRNITDIALTSGFQDSNYFSRAFKKYRSLSPSAYRNQQK